MRNTDYNTYLQETNSIILQRSQQNY